MLLTTRQLHGTVLIETEWLVNFWPLLQGCGLQRQACSLRPHGILGLQCLWATAAFSKPGGMQGDADGVVRVMPNVEFLSVF